MDYKEELTRLYGESLEVELWHDIDKVEYQINALEIKFKETFYKLNLFKFDKSNKIILNLNSDIPEDLLFKYHRLSKELNDVKLEVFTYLKKKSNLKVLLDAIDSDFFTQITKYKTIEDLMYADRTYLFIINKKIKTYIYTFRQLKNICKLLLKKGKKMSQLEMNLNNIIEEYSKVIFTYYKTDVVLLPVKLAEMSLRECLFNYSLIDGISFKERIPVLKEDILNSSDKTKLFYKKYEDLISVKEKILYYREKFEEIMVGVTNPLLINCKTINRKEFILESLKSYEKILLKLVKTFRRLLLELKNICCILIKKEIK